MVLRPEPADPGVPWKRLLIPHPRFPQQTFFNSLLPQTYESTYPHLLTRFEAYWIKERRERWERKEVLDTERFDDENDAHVRQELHGSCENFAKSIKASRCHNMYLFD